MQTNLRNFDAVLRKRGYVGDTRAAKLAYLTLFSAMLEEPVSTLILGASGAGKSFALKTAKQFIPTDAYKEFSGMSEKALAYMGDQLDLKHKTLIIQEAAGFNSERPVKVLWRGVALSLLRCCGSVTPWHEVVQPGDLLIGDTAEHPGQPGLRIDAVQLGSFDQGVGDRRGFSAALGANKEVVFPSDGHGLHGPFRRIVVDLEEAMIEIGPEFLEACQGIADRLCEFRFARNPRQLRRQPGFQIIENGLCAVLAQANPFIGLQTARLFLDGIESGDAPDGFFGHLQALRLEHIDKLATDVCQAGDLLDGAAAIELVEPGIAIGMHPAFEGCQMRCGMLAFAVCSELVPRRRRDRCRPRAVSSRT